ncbi:MULTISPECIES: hypothetical protein [Brenneria]|uniref:Uncharacterized protein n=1 Tax=Brenneria nigrifluens DSM 30175 = ATCC 13028 TaxID=1121120 RepID=A0ABX5V3L8_9GAMM|nr:MULTISPECIES: hypothetical protein [Brenneria]QCR06292.1 hypothetical protein EH206_20345 [Brenneria nigrifluens DSM 30175 = ATCC 13028]
MMAGYINPGISQASPWVGTARKVEPKHARDGQPGGYGIGEVATSADVALIALRQVSRHLNLPVGYGYASMSGHHHVRSMK